MIRSGLFFLAGAVAAVVVLYLAEYELVQRPEGAKVLLDGILLRTARYSVFLIGKLTGPGPGSGIRVVGGSLNVTMSNVTTSTQNGSGHQFVNQFDVKNADAAAFQVDNVSKKQMGSMVNQRYPQDPKATFPPGTKWTVKEYVDDKTDDSRGVQIDGAKDKLSITLKTMSPADWFNLVPISGNLPLGSVGQFHNASACSPRPGRCEKVSKILVTISDGTSDTLYCLEPGGYCHVDIGSY